MATKNTTVRCPNCGIAFEIPENETPVCGVTIAKNSGLGTVYLKEDGSEAKKPLQRRDERGKFMKPAHDPGNDAACACDTCGEGGDKLSDRIRNGKPVKNFRLFRRWVMSQFFHILQELGGCHLNGTSFSSIVRRRGIRYMADVIRNEVHDLCSICRHGDMDEFARRYRWWNPDTVAKIGSEFLGILKAQVEKLKTHKCKGVPYKDIPGFGNVFVSDLQSKVYGPIEEAVRIAENTASVTNGTSADRFEHVAGKLCGLISQFKESSRWKIRMPVTFIDCYKGNGAYFTLRNMIQFHDCRLPDEVRVGKEDLKGWKRDLAILDNLAEQYKNDGWQLVGLVKDTIEANGIDVARKIAGWRK